MEQKKLTRLASELTDFCLENKIFNITCGVKEIKQRIEEQFCDVAFVEGIIKLINDKARNRQDIDADKLIELLAELERLRLELEYKQPESAGEPC